MEEIDWAKEIDELLNFPDDPPNQSDPAPTTTASTDPPIIPDPSQPPLPPSPTASTSMPLRSSPPPLIPLRVVHRPPPPEKRGFPNTPADSIDLTTPSPPTPPSTTPTSPNTARAPAHRSRQEYVSSLADRYLARQEAHRRGQPDPDPALTNELRALRPPAVPSPRPYRRRMTTSGGKKIRINLP